MTHDNVLQKVARAKCNHRKPKWSHNCRKCSDALAAELQKETQRIVATGRCPECSSPLQRNNALAGWYQCAGYATGACSFQCFTK